MALGALPGRIVGDDGAGVILGIGGALALTRLANLLFHVKPKDDTTYAAAIGQRGSRVDAMAALRNE